MSKKAAKKKARWTPSQQPGVNAVRSGSPDRTTARAVVPDLAAADVRLAGKFAPRLGSSIGSDGISQDVGGMPVDANLSGAERRAESNYRTTDKQGITRGPLPGSPEGSLPYPANADRINARAQSKAGPIARLDKALAGLNSALARVKAEPGAGVLDGRIERLESAKSTVERVRAELLAKSGRDSLGTDSDMRALASAESAAPGIGRAASLISRLQNRGR